MGDWKAPALGTGISRGTRIWASGKGQLQDIIYRTLGVVSPPASLSDHHDKHSRNRSWLAYLSPPSPRLERNSPPAISNHTSATSKCTSHRLLSSRFAGHTDPVPIPHPHSSVAVAILVDSPITPTSSSRARPKISIPNGRSCYPHETAHKEEEVNRLFPVLFAPIHLLFGFPFSFSFV